MAAPSEMFRKKWGSRRAWRHERVVGIRLALLALVMGPLEGMALGWMIVMAAVTCGR